MNTLKENFEVNSSVWTNPLWYHLDGSFSLRLVSFMKDSTGGFFWLCCHVKEDCVFLCVKVSFPVRCTRPRNISNYIWKLPTLDLSLDLLKVGFSVSVKICHSGIIKKAAKSLWWIFCPLLEWSWGRVAELFIEIRNPKDTKVM